VNFQEAIECKTGFFFFFYISIRAVYILGVETAHIQLQLISCMAKSLLHSAGWEHCRGLLPSPVFWDQEALPHACSYARINRAPAERPSQFGLREPNHKQARSYISKIHVKKYWSAFIFNSNTINSIFLMWHNVHL